MGWGWNGWIGGKVLGPCSYLRTLQFRRCQPFNNAAGIEGADGVAVDRKDGVSVDLGPSRAQAELRILSYEPTFFLVFQFYIIDFQIVVCMATTLYIIIIRNKIRVQLARYTFL